MDIVRDANDQGHTIIIMVADAQKTRGLDLEKGSFITRPKSYMPIIVSVIITGLKASTNLANAMETRDFCATKKKRTYLHELKMTRLDCAVLGFLICFMSRLTISRFAFGYGSDVIHIVPVWNPIYVVFAYWDWDFLRDRSRL